MRAVAIIRGARTGGHADFTYEANTDCATRAAVDGSRRETRCGWQAGRGRLIIPMSRSPARVIEIGGGPTNEMDECSRTRRDGSLGAVKNVLRPGPAGWGARFRQARRRMGGACMGNAVKGVEIAKVRAARNDGQRKRNGMAAAASTAASRTQAIVVRVGSSRRRESGSAGGMTRASESESAVVEAVVAQCRITRLHRGQNG